MLAWVLSPVRGVCVWWCVRASHPFTLNSLPPLSLSPSFLPKSPQEQETMQLHRLTWWVQMRHQHIFIPGRFQHLNNTCKFTDRDKTELEGTFKVTHYVAEKFCEVWSEGWVPTSLWNFTHTHTHTHTEQLGIDPRKIGLPKISEILHRNLNQ